MKSSRRVSAPTGRPVGVVDIGSNSVRLVVYEGLTRSPAPLFNEKVLCAIGRNLETTGRLDAEGVDLAYRTLARFRAIADGLGIKRLETVATAAARDAKNGADFIARAADLLRGPVPVLSGEEEAKLAAMGVLSGIPEADGLVGDLGGGSLELVSVANGTVGPTAGATLPIGPLRLMDASGGRLDRARAHVDEQLTLVKGLERLKGRGFYAVGGAWRNIARLHMAETRYPLHILHHYEIPRLEALVFLEEVTRMSRKTLERDPAISRRRVETLPYGALVLERILRATEIDRIVISAFGVREGVLLSLVSEDTRRADPLLATCADWAERDGRGPANGERIYSFMTPLFAEETEGERRLRRAACLLSDVGWRNHPDYRANQTFAEIIQGNLAGADHSDRVTVALAVFRRYAGEDEMPELGRVLRLLSPDRDLFANRVGLAARLGYLLSGPATNVLSECALDLNGRDLVLTIPKDRSALRNDLVERRLAALASAFNKEPRVKAR
ncbi:MAG: Ppx/GppA family phosphatase [Alphaproteobacteria bacterium]|nr:Ppx/GppA family phosphatase [Alphaproteobacteria bacterium]